jgi:hypothetical protein
MENGLNEKHSDNRRSFIKKIGAVSALSLTQINAFPFDQNAVERPVGDLPPDGPESGVKGISELFDIKNLPRIRNFRTYMASSYDREGGNFDWSNFERIEKDASVILDVTGPGMITRMWSANPSGILSIYLDDAQVEVQEDFEAFLNRAPMSFGQGLPPSVKAQATGGSLPTFDKKITKEGEPFGNTSYCVIPFTKRCKITLAKAGTCYYQFNYLLFDEPHGLPTFEVKKMDQSRGGYENIKKMLKWDMHDVPSSWQHKKGVVSLTAGSKASIFNEKGPLTIRQMTFSIKWPDGERQAKHLKEKLLLRGYWDDDFSHNPSIKSPLAWFFFDYSLNKSDAYQTALIIKDGNTYSSRFPMPVKIKSALELINDSILDMGEITYDIAYELDEAWDPSLAHFKAIAHIEDSSFGPDRGNYRSEVMYRRNQTGAENYPLLRTWGEGHFIGDCFSIDGRESASRAIGECDEAVFIDDDPKRLMWGTGIEDYLSDAWGFHKFTGQFSGVLKGNGLSGYRFHITDAITFKKKVTFTLEHGSSNNCSAIYKSIAFYYLKPTKPNPIIDEGWSPQDMGRYFTL